MLHRFTIYIPDVDDATFDAIAGACPDSLSGVSGGRTYVDFSREADSLGTAIDAALDDLSALGITPLGVQVDELVEADA